MSPELHWRTSRLPRVLWIELTSRCPFDCVFCTRKSQRGNGQHMDFALYQRVLHELTPKHPSGSRHPALLAEGQRPAIIRLNYSGESGHYPQLAEAITLAKQTGAQVELVSALASLSEARLQAALEAGLDRITVSLHSLDPARFQAIYRFAGGPDGRLGGIETLLQRMQQLLDWRSTQARRGKTFRVDLAFVAMPDNLSDLPEVLRYAERSELSEVAIHPLIARDPLPLGPSPAHDDRGQLSATFRAQLGRAIADGRRHHPSLAITVSSFELLAPSDVQPGHGIQDEQLPVLSERAMAWPWRFPAQADARIAECDQSPFDSVHILADGRVVACEVTEKLSLGDLREQSLHSIWHGEPYRAFRARHHDASEPACRNCVYKRVFRATSAQARLAAGVGERQWLRGWYADDGSGLRWGQREATFWLPRPDPVEPVRRSLWRLGRAMSKPVAQQLRLRGLLAEPGPIEIRINGALCFRRERASSVDECFNLADVPSRAPLPSTSEGASGPAAVGLAPPNAVLLVELLCPEARSPHASGRSADLRELGFGLIEAQIL